ncbi:unnamed protein product, partial [Durusdinium trenchii]
LWTPLSHGGAMLLAIMAKQPQSGAAWRTGIAIYMGLGTLALVVVNHVAGWVVEMSSSRSEEQHFIRFEDSCFTIDPLPSGCFYGVYVESDIGASVAGVMEVTENATLCRHCLQYTDSCQLHHDWEDIHRPALRRVATISDTGQRRSFKLMYLNGIGLWLLPFCAANRYEWIPDVFFVTTGLAATCTGVRLCYLSRS